MFISRMFRIQGKVHMRTPFRLLIFDPVFSTMYTYIHIAPSTWLKRGAPCSPVDLPVRLAGILPRLASLVQQVHKSHRLDHFRGILMCTRCGRWAQSKTVKLAIRCPGLPTRAGRAGRTQPGRCCRLYTQADYDQMATQLQPEIQRGDAAPHRPPAGLPGR